MLRELVDHAREIECEPGEVVQILANTGTVRIKPLIEFIDQWGHEMDRTIWPMTMDRQRWAGIVHDEGVILVSLDPSDNRG